MSLLTHKSEVIQVNLATPNLSSVTSSYGWKMNAAFVILALVR